MLAMSTDIAHYACHMIAPFQACSFWRFYPRIAYRVCYPLSGKLGARVGGRLAEVQRQEHQDAHRHSKVCSKTNQSTRQSTRPGYIERAFLGGGWSFWVLRRLLLLPRPLDTRCVFMYFPTSRRWYCCCVVAQWEVRACCH